jgi:hypothetical protein
VVSEVNGAWGDAIQIPGTPAVGTSSGAQVYAVSCPASGSCAAGGQYSNSTPADMQAFVANQS